jgi:GNAT superfamily N-acetyltransferase
VTHADEARAGAPTAVPARIRAATADDAAAIDEVRLVSWQAAYGELLPADAFAAWDRAAAVDRIAAQLCSGRYRALIAEVAGVPAAFTTFGPYRDDDLSAAGEVYAIYVRPEHWSTGLGRALLPAAVDALGIRPVVLWVLAANARARRFYQLAGWRADGAEKMADLLGGVQLPEVRYRLD